MSEEFAEQAAPEAAEMPTDTPTVLVVDDEPNMRHMLRALLGKNGYDVSEAADGAAALALLENRDFDFILSDVRMPGMDGLELVRRVTAGGGGATVIMMSAYGAAEQAIEAMKQGAYDYISKPFKMDEVLLVLRKARERERLRRENRRLREELRALDGESGFSGMVGESAAMRAVFELAAKVARFEATVLITGESGTGKELVARGIHRLSKGEDAPFVGVNCAGVPGDLLESEFFGHERGAFTGADREKPGLFEFAAGGTLFLDEIGEMPMALQAKLLRVLQEGEVRRVGAVRARKVRVRVLAATNRDLQIMAAQGRFREDLLYRLDAFNIHIPPLREHPEDILPLSSFFLSRLAKNMGRDTLRLSPQAHTRFLAHPWPGNVRELRNVLERAVILADGSTILPEHLPPHLGERSLERRTDDLHCTYSLKEGKRIMETRLIRRALDHCAGNKSRAAELLEISYPALLGKIKEYGLGETKVGVTKVLSVNRDDFVERDHGSGEHARSGV